MDITLRQLVERLQTETPQDWVSIRSDLYPWRRIVAAAERGEYEVSRVGRKLLMRRAELDRFLAAHRIAPKQPKPEEEKPKDEFNASLQRALRRHGLT